MMGITVTVVPIHFLLFFPFLFSGVSSEIIFFCWNTKVLLSRAPCTKVELSHSAAWNYLQEDIF